MDGLPFMPGFRFNDITKQNYHLSAQFQWRNGHALPKEKSTGIGRAPLDVDSTLYTSSSNDKGYNPELTYGKTKDPQLPVVESNFTKLDGKCLSFFGYTKMTTIESPVDKYRVRHVKITYFLVDDTISIVEPVVENSGYAQGLLLRRGPVPNPGRKNRYWHWSDFNVGRELSFYGVVYRLCGCDPYTRRFMAKEGTEIGPDQPIPDDPYTVDRQRRRRATAANGAPRTRSDEDMTKRFLQYDGKVLRFYVAWRDDGCENEWKFFVLAYFMADDRVEIYESKDQNLNPCDHDQFPLFLGKIKLPKNYQNPSPDFPAIYLESKYNKDQKYYRAKDFVVGNTIFVMGRRFLVYDCDQYTRNYFKEMLGTVQPDAIDILGDYYKPTVYTKSIPPHTGIGKPSDTLQNCLSLTPKPAKTLDFVKYVSNAHNKLRYALKMAPVHPADGDRDFVMEYCLGNDQMVVYERAGPNSGFTKGRFMASDRARKPGTAVDDELYYGTADFAIGAELHIKGSLFKIVEVDLRTYKYMVNNKDMFTQEAIDGAKRFLKAKGLIELQESTNTDKSDQYGSIANTDVKIDEHN